MTFPDAYAAVWLEQDVPQLIPATLEVTVPPAAGVFESATLKPNVAVTALAPFSVNEQVEAVPEQVPPDQERKVPPVVAVAVRVTAVLENHE